MAAPAAPRSRAARRAPTHRAQCAALPLYSSRTSGTVTSTTGASACASAASITGLASVQSPHQDGDPAPVKSTSTPTPGWPQCAASASANAGSSAAVTRVTLAMAAAAARASGVAAAAAAAAMVFAALSMWRLHGASQSGPWSRHLRVERKQLRNLLSPKR